MSEPSSPLYPEIEPYNSGWLDVGNGHALYFEECGNPQGTPIVYLHGGPGSASKPKHRQYFDPEKFRIVVFDQRGCGQSQYKERLHANTTDHLIADIDALRVHLGIEAWHLCGGSWGSTLALVYAIRHPQAVRSLTVSGIFTGDDWHEEWFTEDYLGKIYPDAYAQLQQALPAASQAERLALRQQLLAGTRADQLRAAAYTTWECIGMSYFPPEEEDTPPPTPEEQRAIEDGNIRYAKLFTHYDAHGFFLPEGYILENAHTLAHIPGQIIQGRFDLCTPVKAAWDLHQAWPNSTLTILHQASHKLETPALQALMTALHKLV